MLTVAYLANRFPAAVEPYVAEEIRELRGRGVRIIPGSVRTPDSAQTPSAKAVPDPETLGLQPLRLLILLRALALAAQRWDRIAGLIARVFLRGMESPKRRFNAALHTVLGAYYAVLLKETGVDHIHVHHGYFGSWIAMVAARLLGIGFSLTLHGSDLLLDGAYLDTKLEHCRFCVTVSEFNRRYILEHFPGVGPEKLMVSRLGAEALAAEPPGRSPPGRKLIMLAVGRLHAVKDHAFLIRACALLRDRGLAFECLIAGEGPERRRLESLVQENCMEHCVTLLGHVPPQRLDSLYRWANLVVLTSHSEGLPLVLMEAMGRGRIVLAPAITGIPEIVIPGKTGFLYLPGALEDFVAKVLFIEGLKRTENHAAVSLLDWVRHAARVQVLHNFNRETNLNRFADRLLQRIDLGNRSPSDENPLLQQI